MLVSVTHEQRKAGMITRTIPAGWWHWKVRGVDQSVPWNVDTAIEAIRRGFAPWGCIVHVYGFEKTLGCRIVDFQGHPIIPDLRLCSSDLTEPSRLCNVIDQTRARLEEKGFALQLAEDRWCGLAVTRCKRFPVAKTAPAPS